MDSRPPLKPQRGRCWAARDAYFACLDSHGLWLDGLAVEGHDAIVALDPQFVKPRDESDPALTAADRRKLFACRQAKEVFKSECLASWVHHFSVLRVKELQTKHLVEVQLAKEKQLQASPDAFWDKVVKEAQSPKSN
ncbi:hypothetical protein HDU83_000775 [Entophlyctis luteolus]|nr:hypothetical protein HDU82_001206 [Entophlyctis luteolus]KAJ3349082.1 hypothetical protein HDU83_000775 [Entophlyctis luteolus]KAJ3389270.1 hypothetical protein HDU84_008908 [Entophlyctis sp. JEL0112]